MKKVETKQTEGKSDKDEAIRADYKGWNYLSKQKEAHKGLDVEGGKKISADAMTYSGCLWSARPRIPLKRIMFEVSACVIVCLSVGGGAGGGQSRQKDTDNRKRDRMWGGEGGRRETGRILQIEEGMLNSLLRTVEATADKVGAWEQVFEEGETCLLKRVPHKTADSKTCTSRDAGILLLTLVR